MDVALPSLTIVRLQNLSRPRPIALFRRERRKDFGGVIDKGLWRRNRQITGLRFRPKAVATEFHIVSHVTATAAGFLVALISTYVLRNRDMTKAEAEQMGDEAWQQRIAELEQSLENVRAELDVERQRVKIIEKARAAAVTDVTHALRQKRDAEFALSEAQEEIIRLKSNTIKQDEAGGEEGTMDPLPKIVTDQLTPEAQQILKEWLDAFQNEKQKVSSEQSDEKLETDSSLQELKTALDEEEKQRKALEIELRTTKDFARTELKSMTADLVKGRDIRKGLEKKILAFENEVAELRAQLSDSQIRIEELTAQTNLPSTESGRPSPASDRYVHVMRAEAAQMVETIEDKAHAHIQKALQKSQGAQQRALKELIKAMKARDKEKKLRATLEEAEERIREQTLQMNYLKELIQILSSKEMQQQAEEQTIQQNFPLKEE